MDRSWQCCGSARAFGRGGGDSVQQGVRRALGRALYDDDPLVWGAAARGLSHLDDPRAIPDLAEALGRASEAGRLGEVRTIQATLVVLSGGEGPANPGPRSWRDWYDERRQRFEGR